jgi:hypothetical protein
VIAGLITHHVPARADRCPRRFDSWIEGHKTIRSIRNGISRQHQPGYHIEPPPSPHESEDGCLILHNCHIGPCTSDQDTIQLTAEVTNMEFHPVMEHVFLTSDWKRNVCLHDTCMAFVQLLQRMQEGAVQTVCTPTYMTHFVVLTTRNSITLSSHSAASSI